MKIKRSNENWMRYRAEQHIIRRHAKIDELLTKNKWLDRLDYVLKPERWYFSVMLTIVVFVLVAWLSGVFHLAYRFRPEDTKAPDFGKFIDDRASNLATIASMSMAVIGFLVTNIAIKELYAIKLLFKRTKLSFVIIFALTALAIFVLVSGYRYTHKASVSYNDIVLASAFMLIIVLVLIGYVFIRVIYFIDPDQIDAFINRQLAADAFIIIREGLLQTISADFYRIVMNQAGVKPYNLSDANWKQTFMDNLSLLNDDPAERVELPRSYVIDLDLSALRTYLQDHKTEPLLYQQLHIGAMNDFTDDYVFVPGRTTKPADKAKLAELLIKSNEYPQLSTVGYIRKHHDEKLVSLAEGGKHKELQRVLIGIADLYKKQFEYQLPKQFDVTWGLPALLVKALRAAIKGQHYSSFWAVFKTTFETSDDAIVHLHEGIYTSLLFIYTDLYLQIYPKRLKKGFKDFFSLTLQATATFEALLNGLTAQKRIRPEKITELNSLAYHTFKEVSELGFHILNKQDLPRIKALAEMLDRDIFDQPEVDVQIEFHHLANDPAADREDLAKVRKRYKEAFAFRTYRRHTLFGLQSWLIHLKRNNHITDNAAAEINQLLRIDYYESRDALSDILQIAQGQFVRYFNWVWWKLPQDDNDGEVGTENSVEWQTFGFFVGQILHNQVQYFLFGKAIPVNHDQLAILISSFEKYKLELLENFDNWREFLRGVDTRDELSRRADELISLFTMLSEQINLKNLREIAEEPLNEEMLQQFYAQALVSWRSEAHLWQLLTQKGAIVNAPAGTALPFIGRNNFERDLKRLLLHYDRHNDVNILRPMIGYAGRQTDTVFLETVVQQVSSFREGQLTDLIIEALKQLRGGAYVPDAIIVAPAQSFSNDRLTQHPLFKQPVSDDSVNREFEIGTFDGVPLYYTHSHAAVDHVFVYDLKAAINVKCQMADNLSDRFLQLKVIELPADEARDLAARSVLASGNVENEEKIALELRNGLRLVVGVNAQLEIINQDALKVGTVTRNRPVDS